MPANVKPPAEVGRHGDKAAVRTCDRHVGEWGLFRENDRHPVAVVGGTAHQIVSLCKQFEDLFGIIDAFSGIENPCCDDIGF